jgi:hypothetical protein
LSLAELNAAIRALLDDLNNRLMRSWGITRRMLYEQLDRPALVSLPPVPYEYAEWKRCRVGLDYHVEIVKHYYSVPHQLLRHEVEARFALRSAARARPCGRISGQDEGRPGLVFGPGRSGAGAGVGRAGGSAMRASRSAR